MSDTFCITCSRPIVPYAERCDRCAAISAAEDAAYERAAKLCETFNRSSAYSLQQLAKAIRALKSTKSTPAYRTERCGDSP